VIFESLVPFEEAIHSNRVKSLLPTSLSSEQLRQMASQVKRGAVFSARVTNAKFLQGVKDTVGSILEPKRAKRGATEGFNPATAREELRDLADQLSVPQVQNDPRIDLIVRTQSEMAWGFGNFQQGQSDVILNAFPCQELFRAGEREEPRDWFERWEAAGGQLYGGRMIARKDDEVWQALGDGEGGYKDTLGNPFPPFAFNSGMDVRDVSREEAVALGVIDEDEDVEPTDLEFIEGLGEGVLNFARDIKDALLDSLGDGFKVRKGVLMADEEQPAAGTREWRGLTLVIETEAGDVRTGIASDGTMWASVMPWPYGYVGGTVSDDLDALDVFVGPAPSSERVFVIVQYDPVTREFDELKAMLDFPGPEEAKQGYFDAFTDGSGPEHFGGIEEMSVEDFVAWMKGAGRQDMEQLEKETRSVVA
jgi:hypothetical protein